MNIVHRWRSRGLFICAPVSRKEVVGRASGSIVRERFANERGGMSEQRLIYENRHFGQYLRRIREDRNLSLDAVEEMTLGYPEPVTKSHLSRIENGRAVPTFPRMFALSQVYGVPISSMAERFESDLKSVDESLLELDFAHMDAVFERLQQLRQEGRYDVILRMVEAASDRRRAAGDGIANESDMKLAIWQLSAMIKVGHYESGKVRCEELMSLLPDESEYYLRTLIFFIICSYRLRRFKVAKMGFDQLQTRMQQGEWSDALRASAHSTGGSVHQALRQHEEAKGSFEMAMEAFRNAGEQFESCRARVNLSQALISLEHHGAAIRHLHIAIAEANENRYQFLLALASSHLAVAHFAEGDLQTAESCALRSNAIARTQEWKTMLFRNCYYLWKIATQRSDATSLAANERTLRALMNRITDDSPEVDRFRRFVEGGDQ